MTERRTPRRWIDDPDHTWPRDFRETLGSYAQIHPPAELSARVYERIEAAVAPPPATANVVTRPRWGLFGPLATASAAIVLYLALRSASAAVPEHAVETPSPVTHAERSPSPPLAALAPPDALPPPTPTPAVAVPPRSSSEPARSVPSPRRWRRRTTDTKVEHGSAAAAATPADAGAELTLLIRARSIVRTAPARALELAGQHAATYPKSAFAEEREVLTIEAERRLGRAAAADARAREFLGAHPNSIHRALIETSTTHR